MPDFSMSISQYTYEHLVGLHEDGDYEGLFHWLAGIEPEKGTPKWWGKEWLKYNPAEGHDRDFTEILKEALSDVTFWFLGEDTEYLRKKFWVQAFGKAGDVVPLGKIINRKVHEIFRSAYVREECTKRKVTVLPECAESRCRKIKIISNANPSMEEIIMD